MPAKTSTGEVIGPPEVQVSPFTAVNDLGFTIGSNFLTLAFDARGIGGFLVGARLELTLVEFTAASQEAAISGRSRPVLRDNRGASTVAWLQRCALVLVGERHHLGRPGRRRAGGSPKGGVGAEPGRGGSAITTPTIPQEGDQLGRRETFTFLA